MRFQHVACFALFASLLVGCASPAPQPALPADLPNPAQGRGLVYVETPKDVRDNPEMGPTYFGTIRGGLGNPVERLHFTSPASVVVQSVAINVLRSLGFRAERVPERAESQAPDAKVLNGKLTLFNAGNNAYGGIVGSRHVQLNMELCLSPGRWCKTVSGREEDKHAAGVSGNTEVMGPWLRKLLEDKLVAAFSEPAFAAALTSTAQQGREPTARLGQLEPQLKDGLITN